MTPSESPSSLLERAAARLEELAGPITDYYGTGQSMPLPNKGLNELAVVLWQITMSPSVAPPLVAWLRRAASYFAPDGPLSDEDADTDPYAGPAVQFARLVLGEL